MLNPPTTKVKKPKGKEEISRGSNEFIKTPQERSIKGRKENEIARIRRADKGEH